jgi:hypothetical protein
VGPPALFVYVAPIHDLMPYFGFVSMLLLVALVAGTVGPVGLLTSK